jgi:hypothetical protein
MAIFTTSFFLLATVDTYEYLITKTDHSKKYKKVTKVEFSLKKLVSSSQLFVDADFGSVESL